MIIGLPKYLGEQLGDKGVDELLTILNQSADQNKASIMDISTERFERRLKEEISQFRVEVNEEISQLRLEGALLRGEMKSDLAAAKSEIIKWMFLFWMGQTTAIIGILFAFFK